jgi:ribosome-associated protein
MKPAPNSPAPEHPALAEAQDVARPSKTQRKQAMTALQQLGEELLRLSASQLDRIDLPESLRDALQEARRITAHEGRRRQMQYIGRLMRQVDPDPIRRALSVATGESRAAAALMHRCERWRERLLGDDAALTEFLDTHPQADAQRLRTLIRSARREQAGGAAPKNARDLYRWLHDILQQESDAS